MKITYKPNPLDTVVELDDHEKQILWYKIRCQELQDLLYDAYFHLKEKWYDMERVNKALDPEYYLDETDDTKSPLDKRCDEMLEYMLAELQSNHFGDCTCIASSCGKCHAEQMVGIDTIPGLGKHSAYKIDDAFRTAKNTREALIALENYNPEINDAWKGNEKGWHEHLPRWKSEAKVAYEWLKKYNLEHGPWE